MRFQYDEDTVGLDYPKSEWVAINSIRWVMDFRPVTKSVRASRLQQCHSCELYTVMNNKGVCSKCNCVVKLMTYIPKSMVRGKCPVGKW